VTKRQTLTYLLFAIFMNIAHGQSITPFLVSSTGTFTSSTAYSLTYSVGEIATASLFSHNHYLTQGFQQTYPKSFDGPYKINSISISPNPFKDDVYVNFYISEPCDFLMDIYSLCGKKIISVNYEDILYGERKKINLEFLPKGLYMVHIYSKDGKISRVIKIEKM
jgi:hypothetical protein